MVLKNCRRPNVLKQTKSYFLFCLATADSISINVSPTKGPRFIMKKINQSHAKKTLKQHKTGRRHSSAHVNRLQLRTCENNINVL